MPGQRSLCLQVISLYKRSIMKMRYLISCVKILIVVLVLTLFLKFCIERSAFTQLSSNRNLNRPSYGQKGLSDKASLLTPVVRKERCIWEPPPKRNVIPKIKLDPTKFLYPGIRSGPNNQMRQLLKIVHVAILLNRTLVVPNFYSHFSVGQQIVQPYQRVDVDRICGLVSCVTLETFQKVCNGTFHNVFLQKQNFPGNFYITTAKDTGLAIRWPWDKTTNKVKSTSGLTVERIFPNKQLSLTEIKEYFNVPKPCALYPGHADDMSFFYLKPSLPLPDMVEDISKLQEDDLKFAIMEAVGALPQVIDDIALAYSQKVFKGDYVGVHWRYDDSDWARHCTVFKDPTCKNFKRISGKHIATAIHNDLQKSMTKFTQGINIYIAAPPSMLTFAQSIVTELKRLNSTFHIASQTLKEFVTDKIDSCFKKNNWHFGDTLSLIEMALMQRSEYFYYSKSSTWSKNCQQRRWFVPQNGKLAVMKYEASIFDLSEAVLMSGS